MVKCANCGKDINEHDRKMCSHCGFSACKFCVPVTTCPKCNHVGTMKQIK